MDIRALKSLIRVMESIDPHLTIQQVQVFLTVIGSDSLRDKGYVPLSEVVERSGYTLAAVSRTCVAFGPHMKPNKRTPGLNLIERREDPENNRKKNLFLTQRGKLVRKQIQEICDAD